MTSLRQPVGVWHEIVMRTPRACLWTVYLVLHFTREHFVLSISRLSFLLEQLVRLPDMGF